MTTLLGAAFVALLAGVFIYALEVRDPRAYAAWKRRVTLERLLAELARDYRRVVADIGKALRPAVLATAEAVANLSKAFASIQVPRLDLPPLDLPPLKLPPTDR